jgi:hypothetical protein
MEKIDQRKLLANYLELAHGPYNDRRKEIVDKEIPRELTTYQGDNIVKVRELLQTESIVGTTLVPAQVLATVIDGAEPEKCMRSMIPIFNAKGQRSLVVPLGETGTYAAEVAEGAAAEDDEVTYTAATHTVKKYVSKPSITEEMIADGQWDVVAHEVSKAGARLENTFNHVTLGTLLDGSGDEIDASATNVGVVAVTSAMAEMMANGFKPDRIVLHPTAAGWVLRDMLPTGGYFPVGDQTASGLLPPSLLGMKPGICGTTTSAGSYTWGYGTDGYIGMLLLDSRSCGAAAMNQDITLTEFDDVIRGIKSFKCMMRFGVATHQAYAAERIEY